MIDIDLIGKNAKAASRLIAVAPTQQKNAAIGRISALLPMNKNRLAAANRKDIEAGLPANLLGRLVFDEGKVESRIQSLRKIIELPDPVGQIEEMECRPSPALLSTILRKRGLTG